ncbi:MAG: DUF4147 domain-containing protein [Thermomicrobium sp.]|nr:DUF4147 domain-containing protein [Thermomicrobium sp.]MDW7981950.1 DUF4147 domain-containing protein [Thermomicrobium sp.]
MPEPRLKRFVEDIFRETLNAVDPERLVREALERRDTTIIVRGVPHRLEPRSRLVLLALGKAAAAMASGAVQVLGDRVDRCVVIPKSEDGKRAELARCTVIPGSHPLPDLRSLRAGHALLDAVRGLGPDDLVLVLLSGGASALAEVPRPPLTLEQVVTTTERLLRAGADIWLLNAVRRHLSALKGGGLARAAAPARIVNLVLSDVLGSPLPIIGSGPTVEPSDPGRALPVTLRQLGVWEEFPAAVQRLLAQPDEGSIRLPHVLQSVVLADARVLVRAAVEALRRRDLPAVPFGSRYTGEAREFGRFWATLAWTIREEHVPWKPPVALVGAGELTVTVRGRGRGGRNTEMALAAALVLSQTRDVTVASLASDGDDGTSGAAGAVVDGTTAEAVQQSGIDPQEALAQNDSATALASASALVVTGLTGTNVNDLYLALVDGRAGVTGLA